MVSACSNISTSNNIKVYLKGAFQVTRGHCKKVRAVNYILVRVFFCLFILYICVWVCVCVLSV